MDMNVEYLRVPKEKIDYSKPIGSFEDGKVTEILMPVLGRSYEVAKYCWFNLSTGRFSSCKECYTPKEAVAIRHDVRNVTINVEEM